MNMNIEENFDLETFLRFLTKNHM